jgi:hypothetical protein
VKALDDLENTDLAGDSHNGSITLKKLDIPSSSLA